MIVVLMTLITGVSPLFAQEQENKLINRLLQPDLSLTNPAQNKQFATKTASVEQGVQTGAFCITERSPAKSFGRTRVLSPREFAARHFRTGDSPANLAPRSQPNTIEIDQVAPAPSGARVAPENGRTVAVSQFADNRPFLGQGKSQKALSARDTPLTIDQVRELLNKNK